VVRDTAVAGNLKSGIWNPKAERIVTFYPRWAKHVMLILDAERKHSTFNFQRSTFNVERSSTALLRHFFCDSPIQSSLKAIRNGSKLLQGNSVTSFLTF